MPVINILPDDVINKIAAGEVVERPASVVKELIENSLDAGAASIKVDVLYGGRRLIAVSDDGSGMDRRDVLKCVERHATSKITREEDLENIATMGFRGEALSSIASVSRMKIASSPEGAVLGVVVEIHGGRVMGEKDKAVRGTTVEVRDLFYNTPARHKFLKSAQSELYHIIENVTQAALAHPERAFYLKSDEKDLLSLQSAAGLAERLVQLYGREFTEGLIPVSRSFAGVSVTGLTSREGRYGKTRAEQYFFVNRRPIRDAALRLAVCRAYGNLLPGGAQPMFFIYIETDPARVDFNVHPSKREVRFLDREGMFSLLHSSVKDAVLGGAGGAGVRDDRDARNVWAGRAGVPAASLPTQPPDDFRAGETVVIPYAPARSYLYLGDVFAAYAEGGGLVLLDHHAAHERVLYERLKDGAGLAIQELLFPVQTRFTARRCAILRDNLDEIRRMGIVMEEFGPQAFIIRALPLELGGADPAALLSDVAESLADDAAASPIADIRDKMAMRIACHASVRGARVLGAEELNRLLSDLDAARDPGHCPHGRPTRITLSPEDLRRMFKRK
jgi:DNA mismatch repair protein MutL